jgi:lipid-A-disaccharide synthase
MNTVMIISGESSGELYGSLLAKSLKSRLPHLKILGVGGKRMREAGVELVSSISDAFGLIEAISAYSKIKAAFRNTIETLKKFKPDVLVLIDYPDFNIKLAKIAKSCGIKILYYVSPQVWAWRKGRIKKIANIVDRMAVLFPFEEKIYREAGVKCEFVGHPIVEEIESVLESTMKKLPPLYPPLVRGGIGGWSLNPELRTYFKSALDLDPTKPLISLLPGSRPHELKRLLPLMIDVVRQFKNKFADYQFCIPLALNTEEERYNLYLQLLRKEGVNIKKGESVRVLAASDTAVVASGTATLQTALLGVPMVVVYKLSPFTFFLGKLIVDVKHISIVNILAGREVIKELLQKKANPENIIKELKKIILDKKYREEMLQAYRSIKKPFLEKRPSERVAEIVIEMAA